VVVAGNVGRGMKGKQVASGIWEHLDARKQPLGAIGGAHSLTASNELSRLSTFVLCRDASHFLQKVFCRLWNGLS
jgi:hypothetical protein